MSEDVACEAFSVSCCSCEGPSIVCFCFPLEGRGTPTYRWKAVEERERGERITIMVARYLPMSEKVVLQAL